MAEFTCTINTDKPAFDDPDELPRLLRQITYRIENLHTFGPVFDINGNGVGRWEWKS